MNKRKQGSCVHLTGVLKTIPYNVSNFFFREMCIIFGGANKGKVQIYEADWIIYT